MNKEQKLKSLTALRFIFFLCVFFSHYIVYGSRILPNAGEFAVVFFFMLSGFSLSVGYGPKINSLKYGTFIKLRMLRLWPMQFLTVLLRAIPILLIPIVLGGFEVKNLISFILKLFFLEAWVPDSQIIFNYNMCAWYLSPLVFCYFIFPWLFKWVNKVKTGHILTAIVAYIMVYASCVYLIPTDKHQVFLYAAPYFRFFDFALGIVIYKMYSQGVLKLLGNSILAYVGEGILLLIIALVAWLPLSSLPSVIKMASIYWVPAFVVLVVFIAIDCAGKIKLLNYGPLQKFGDASYEMYMTHLFMVSVFQHLAEMFFAGTVVLNLVCVVACLVCSILLGLAVRKWFNIPVSNYIKKKYI